MDLTLHPRVREAQLQRCSQSLFERTSEKKPILSSWIKLFESQPVLIQEIMDCMLEKIQIYQIMF